MKTTSEPVYLSELGLVYVVVVSVTNAASIHGFLKVKTKDLDASVVVGVSL